MLKLVTRKLRRLYGACAIVVNHFRRRLAHCSLHVTYRCNFRCGICDYWREEHDASEELTLDEIRLASAKLRRHGPMAVTIAGGEPMLRRDIHDIIAALVDDGHMTLMTTNGWFVDDSAARDLFRAGLEEAFVSLDYRDPARHDAQRGREGAWERAVKALGLLRRHRSRRQRVHIVTVLMDDNLDQVEPLLELAEEFEATVFLTLYSHMRGRKSRISRDTKMSAHLLDLKRRYKSLGSPASYLERVDEAIACGGVRGCCAGEVLFSIGRAGNVSRCLDLPDESAGNILSDSLPVLQRRLARLRAERPCSGCWVACRGFAEALRTPPRSRRLKEVRCR